MNAASARDLAAASTTMRAANSPRPPLAAINDAHFAVVVGINRYPGFTDLEGPLDDAADFVDWLVSPGGGALPKENVFEVPAPRDLYTGGAVHRARPNVPDVVDAVRSANLAVEALTKADPDAWWRSRLYMFVAGHGMVPEHCDSVALFTADASHEELGHNINLREYKLWYQQCGHFRDLVVFADCCRRLMLDAPSYGPPFTWCRTGRPGVRTVMGYSTQFATPAWEGPSAVGTRGYFSTALLNALRHTGSVDSPQLRWGDLKGMINIGLRGQRAEFAGDDDIEFGLPVAAGHRPDPRPVRIHFTDPAGGQVDLLDGRLMPIGQWSPYDGEWQLTLPDGLYQLVRHGTRDELQGFTVMGGDIDVQL